MMTALQNQQQPTSSAPTNFMLPPNLPSTSQTTVGTEAPKTVDETDPLDSSDNEDNVIEDLADINLGGGKMNTK